MEKARDLVLNTHLAVEGRGSLEHSHGDIWLATRRWGGVPISLSEQRLGKGLGRTMEAVC